MRDINENTVSAENQLPRDASTFYMGAEDAPKRLLILGVQNVVYYYILGIPLRYLYTF